MGDDQHRGTRAGAIAQQRQDALGGDVVELPGRLVAQQDRRVVGERDGQAGAGELATGQLRRAGARARRDAAALEDLGAPGAAGPRVTESLGQRDVRVHRQMPDEVGLLVDHAELAGAQGGALLLGAARQALAVDADHAAVGLVEPRQARQQGRLARAGGPRDRHDLAGRDRQRDALERQRLVVARVVEAIQAVGLEQRAHRVYRSESVTIFHGSTLSAPLGPESVSTTRCPLWKKT